MNLDSQLLELKTQRHELPLAQRAELSCRLAKQLEKAGEYEGACEALSEFWPELDQPPRVEGLDERTTAVVLLRVGALAGWQGGADQTDGSQETAKNLITKSIEIFDRIGESEEACEARGDLALCYWREGAFDEARIHLTTALSRLGEEDSERRAILLIRAGLSKSARAGSKTHCTSITKPPLWWSEVRITPSKEVSTSNSGLSSGDYPPLKTERTIWIAR